MKLKIRATDFISFKSHRLSVYIMCSIVIGLVYGLLVRLIYLKS